MRAVIFDLDGTLADTLLDIAHAVNHGLGALGCPPHPLEDYRRFVGGGVESLARTVLPPAERGLAPRLVELFRAYYLEHLLDHTRPYAGIPELLVELESRGVAMAVLSNKPHAPTRRIVDALFGAGRFVEVFGERAGVPRKPDPAAVLELVRCFARAAGADIARSEVALVGDSAFDVRAAHAASVVPIGVLWGFRGEKELREAGALRIARTPAEILTHM